LPKTLLIEAGFLCLPDKLFASALPDLREPISQALRQEKFEFSRLRCWFSQHRIGILVEGLADAQADAVKEVRGPRAAGAFDYNNLPSLAVQGFAAAQGVQFKDLVTREIDGEKYLFAVKSLPGQSLEKSVGRIRDAILSALNFSAPPWSSQSKFPQPPVYFTAMLDEKVCDLDLDGMKAGNITASHDGLTLTNYELSNAQAYPQIINQIGVICESAERRKIFETRVRSVLPEGYNLRSEGARISHLCYYKESLQPLLIKFNPAFLDIPEAVLHRYIIKYFGYLACENHRGRMMPAVIAVSERSQPQSQEIQLRSAELERHFSRLMTLWKSDLQKVPERLVLLAAKLEQEKVLAPEPGSHLARCIVWLLPKLGLESAAVDANILSALIAEGERTAISDLLPSTGFAVVINCIGEIAAFKKMAPLLQEICDYFAGRIPAPGNVAAQIVCLALLMRDHVASDSVAAVEPARIIALLRAVNFRIDIFQAFADVYPEHHLSRRLWLQPVVADALKESQTRLTSESFLSTFEFDPVSFYEAIRSWKDVSSSEIDSLSALYQRMRSKVDRTQVTLEEIADCQIEKEIVSSLSRIEKLPGICYHEIFEFYQKEKVNIEACLMNLPPVLDDTNPEHASRIQLLQRLVSQLAHLPFISREKVSTKK
jgi:hypothetical protein